MKWDGRRYRPIFLAKIKSCTGATELEDTMRSVIRIGQREVAVESNAATAIRYKQIFKRELLKDLAKLENVEDVDKLDAIEYTSKLAYVMNMQNRKEIKEASEEGYIAWMEEFDEADFQDPAAITSILNVWNRNITTTSELKKDQSPQ